MKREFIIAIDQGTTGTRVFLFDRSGTPVATEYKEHTQWYPQPGWVEHDADEIWQVTSELLQRLLRTYNVSAENVAGIGITNQRETLVVWDRETGKPLHRAIVWQCRRSASICEEFTADGVEPMIRQKTGLRLDPYFSGSKIAWLLQQDGVIQQAVAQGRAAIGTIDSWLIYKLTQGESHVTDVTNASRTLLFNIHDLQWDDDLLKLFNVPRSALPEIVPSSGRIATTKNLGFLPEGIWIAGIAGDQQAALFGQGCFQPGMAKNTYGTGCFVLMQTGDQPVASDHGLLTTVAWDVQGKTQYALEGSIFIAGAAIQWLRDGLKILDHAAVSERMAQAVSDSGGVYFVPAFVGLGAPHWDMHARGTFTGITGGITRDHIVRSALEAIAYQTKDVLRAMEHDSGISLKALRVDGGAAANRFLMQFQADMLGIPVERPAVMETTALGAAYLAGFAIDWWPDFASIADQQVKEARFTPEMNEQEREKHYRGWQRAIERAKG